MTALRHRAKSAHINPPINFRRAVERQTNKASGAVPEAVGGQNCNISPQVQHNNLTMQVPTFTLPADTRMAMLGGIFELPHILQPSHHNVHPSFVCRCIIVSLNLPTARMTSPFRPCIATPDRQPAQMSSCSATPEEECGTLAHTSRDSCCEGLVARVFHQSTRPGHLRFWDRRRERFWSSCRLTTCLSWEHMLSLP